MRLAWFTPLPPTRSGIADYSAELLPVLAATHHIDVFVVGPVPQRLPAGPDVTATGSGPDQAPAPGSPSLQFHGAHDFVRRHDRSPYDLVVYQLGNATCHDYMWPYLVRYPGLLVLHDAQLHHSRAKALLDRQRDGDYRAEFAYCHPEVDPAVADLFVAGFPGSLPYFWPMLGVAVRASRAVAVHNARLARDLGAAFGGVPVHVVRMGVRAHEAHGPVPERDDRLVTFAAFGLVTPEKRVPEILRAAAAVARAGLDFRLVLVGDAAEHYDAGADIERLGLLDRVTVTGYVDDLTLDRWLAAADVCLCLRWPTSRETSASWLRCLAAGKPTVITALPDLADVPSLDPRGWTLDPHAGNPPTGAEGSQAEAVAVAIDLVEEGPSLEAALARLTSDAALRQALGRNARRLWAREHTVPVMARDYLAAIEATARTPPGPRRDAGLPAHLFDDGSATVRAILDEMDVVVDLFEAPSQP
jgi:glycosyltransferase involved in cell wall biosynthesis